jgi:hypothetical protein
MRTQAVPPTMTAPNTAKHREALQERDRLRLFAGFGRGRFSSPGMKRLA